MEVSAWIRARSLDRLVLDKRGLDLFLGEYATPGFFDPFHIGAVEPRHLAHPFAEIAVAADDDRIARFHEIAEGGFHARAAGPRHRESQGVLGLKYRPQQGLFLVHQGKPLRIEISDKCRTHGAKHAGMDGAGAGTEKETVRYIQIIDCKCHIHSPYIVRSGEVNIHIIPGKSNSWTAMKILSDKAGFAYNGRQENVKDKSIIAEEKPVSMQEAQRSADDILLDKKQFSL